MRPILIVGARDVGKTTLIRRLISDMSRPIGGFCTEKRLTDSTGAHSVYLHPAGLPLQARSYTPDNRVGRWDGRTFWSPRPPSLPRRCWMP